MLFLQVFDVRSPGVDLNHPGALLVSPGFSWPLLASPGLSWLLLNISLGSYSLVACSISTSLAMSGQKAIINVRGAYTTQAFSESF